LQAINQVRTNAHTGRGSESLQNYQDQKPKIYSGGLAELDQTAKGGAKGSSGPANKDAEKKKNADLNDYFDSMKSKDTPTILNSKMQKKLDENKKRRNIMKSQFGQFSSFSAV